VICPSDRSRRLKASASATQTEHRHYNGDPRIITDQTKRAMWRIRKEIQDGAYPWKWIAENASGRKWFESLRQQDQECQIERMGPRLCSTMAFVEASTVKQSRNRPPVQLKR
jgi:ketol-acid reductoisomerase